MLLSSKIILNHWSTQGKLQLGQSSMNKNKDIKEHNLPKICEELGSVHTDSKTRLKMDVS